MNFETIIVKKEDGIGTIILNRPDRLNALSDKLLEELGDAIQDVAEDDAIRVVVLTGAGQAFCAGGDVQEFVGGTEAAKHDQVAKGEINVFETQGWVRSIGERLILPLQKMIKPTIAMVNGVAVGGGFDIALACDMRIGSEKTRFRVAFTKVALTPGTGGTWLLPRICGIPKAAELIFTGDIIDGAEAERWGLINRLVPSAELEAKTMELARKIADGPPIAIRLDKLLLYRGLEVDLETSLQFSGIFEPMTLQTLDHQEGVAAFREKRKPKFQGK